MGKLEDLRKKIYSKEGADRTHDQNTDFIQITHSQADDGVKHVWMNDRSADDQLLKEKYVDMEPEPSHRLLYAFIGVGLLVIMGLGVAIYYQLRSPPVEAGLVIISKKETDVGNKISWEVLVENKSAVPFKDVELVFTYPKGTNPITESIQVKSSLRDRVKIGDVQAGETKRYEFRGELFGLEKEEKTAESLLIYRPENLKSKLTAKASWVTVLSRVPIIVAVSFPEEVRSGQDMQIDVTIDSISDAIFRNVAFGIDYPIGFEFSDADISPSFDSKNIWALGDLGPRETRKISIHGNIKGSPTEIKAFIGRLGEYNDETREWTPYAEVRRDSHIAGAPLYVHQEINGSPTYIADPGEGLRYSVKYQNNYREAIKDVFIKLKLTESLVDMRSLSIGDGFYDGVTHEIIWNAGSHPDLKELGAGESGSVDFSVNLKNQPPIRTVADKNLVLRSSAVIDTAVILPSLRGVQIDYHDDFDIKLNSRPALIAKAIFYNSPLGVRGELPPRVGKETGYTVIWQVGNFANDIKEARVTATLPGNVKWLNIVSGDGMDKVRFNQTTGEIVWDLGVLEAGTGVLGSRRTRMFMISLTPGENSIQHSADLVDHIKILGVDAFTGKEYFIPVTKLTTAISDDPKATRDDWTVLP